MGTFKDFIPEGEDKGPIGAGGFQDWIPPKEETVETPTPQAPKGGNGSAPKEAGEVEEAPAPKKRTRKAKKASK